MCHGRWGSLAARLGERLRRAVDLEHWAAFQRSFEQLNDLLRDGQPRTRRRAAGDDRRPERRRPHDVCRARSISGRTAGPSRVYQLVCSPFRNPLSPFQRRFVRATGSARAARVLRAARAPGRRLSPDCAPGATSPAGRFDNAIGELAARRGSCDRDALPRDPERRAGRWARAQLASSSSAQIHRRVRARAERRAGE